MAYFSEHSFYFENKLSYNPTQENFHRHLHNEYELYYFLEGDVDYLVGESLYRLRKGDLLLIRPSVYHFPTLKSDAPYRRIVINFSKEFLPAELPPALEQMEIFYEIPPVSAIGRAFTDAVSVSERYSEEDAYIALKGLLHFILLELKYTARPQSGAVTAVHPRLREILRYIDDHLDSPLDLPTLAKQFFVSESWITHAFRNRLQISVMQYVNRKRILAAQQMIASGVPPTEAAAKYGFGNYSTFYRHYKRYLHASPNEDKRN